MTETDQTTRRSETARPDAPSAARRPDARQIWTRGCFRELAASEGDRRRRVEESIVLAHLDVVDRLVHRLAPRYRDDADLRQVGCVGLINAVRRYDSARGEDFLAFAVPTISGEIKRYLRDQGWFVRPPRRVQELRLAIVAIEPDLAQRLRHEPTTAEFATQLDVGRDEVAEATGTPTSLRPVSLDATGPDEETPFGATIGGVDREFDRVEVRVPVQRALAQLSHAGRGSREPTRTCSTRSTASPIGSTTGRRR